VFITRASRHDRDEIVSFLESQGRPGDGGSKGTVFFAREGSIVGAVRLVEVAPQALVIDEMVVDQARRRQGIGTNLMQAAMNSRGGTLYVSTDPAYAAFFNRLGFEEVAGDAPEPVATHLASSPEDPDAVVMRAR
jgi:N-acetylglutamate synthase-like GNAT family acetyltransferase